MLVKSQAKYIQSLGQKKHRDETGMFVAEGPKLVAELMRSIPFSIEHIYGLEEWMSSHDTAGFPSTTISEMELEKISQLKTANQVVAVVRQMEESTIDPRDHFTLVLDTIQDPGNLGTIVRIADWFGVKQIVCSEECADIYNPKVVQATMGSIGRMKMQYTSLNEWMSRWKDIRTYAAVLDGQDIRQVSLPQEAILIIGNESKGISEELLAKSNVKITISRKGAAESLNAAVAAGIILSHLLP